MKRILFVCTGNICRSPTAEGVLRQLAAAVDKPVTVDSAGTGGWHSGEAPDKRARHAAVARGYDLSGITARKVRRDDFSEFDIIYAMATDHLHHLQGLAAAAQRDKVALFLADTLGRHEDLPDPYYGGNAGFEYMMDLLEAGCAEIVKRLE